MTAPPYLTQDQIDEITEPLTRPADQCRVLREMGFLVKQKPSGRPLVARSNFELVMGGGVTAPSQAEQSASGQEPDPGALAKLVGRKGVKYADGKKTGAQPTWPA